MKRYAAILTALCLCFSAACAAAFEEEFDRLCEDYTYYHYAFFMGLGEYEFGDNFPLLPLQGGSYGLPAFSTQSRLFDAVFMPDESGTAIQTIHLLGTNSALDSGEKLRVGAAHVTALLYPFYEELEYEENRDFGLKMQDEILRVNALRGLTEDYYAPSIILEGIGSITVYRMAASDTFGIMVRFDRPVTARWLGARYFLLNDVVGE